MQDEVEADVARQIESGRAAVGTGPYAFVEYTPREKLVLTRFDDYWGETQEWSEVTFLELQNDQTRVAALQGWLVEHHPYDVPEVIALPVEEGLPAYFEWVARETEQ